VEAVCGIGVRERRVGVGLKVHVGSGYAHTLSDRLELASRRYRQIERSVQTQMTVNTEFNLR